MHLSRENWTLPGAQRAYSSQSNAAYQARNYASNINEYNKVLGEISLRKQWVLRALISAYNVLWHRWSVYFGIVKFKED